MPDLDKHLSRSRQLSQRVAQLYQKRIQSANQRFTERVTAAQKKQAAALAPADFNPFALWTNWSQYAVDLAQRSVLFWDTLRQRGNNFNAHEQAGKPPVLQFEYQTVLDGRTLPRPANYALLRIVPPAGVTVDDKRRPYIVIDPRAGHGPGIGGFKDDSQIGVALRAGHPVYFVSFYPEPEPGQTLLDVCEAEATFVRKVRELHPQSSRPAIIGNCQGGWAAMMLAASNPDDTGPIVINGAPMSYWGGAWQDGEGDNPMRYAGGMLGGTWLSSFVSDLAGGKFDGAWLVQNFENLNPANTFWSKYYHLFANVDSEAPRFLEFERWWGGFYLLNREEIEWITKNLFVGNKAWAGGGKDGAGFDLRQIKAPIVLFASMGDNITPPQQAFNWVADVYGSTEEIKARGQVIVGLLHEDIGHLGIFVSGKVAKKEHTQIVSVLKSIESLPPGLWAMKINEQRGAGGETEYEVEFTERRLEEISARLNRLKRVDEKPFEAVAAVSEFNQRAYEMFAQPMVQSLANDYASKLQIDYHPLRFQRWALSDSNPWMQWLGPVAETVRAQRQTADKDQPFRKLERAGSELLEASLEYYRETRDAASEAAFFQTYGNLFSVYLAERREAEAQAAPADPRELPFVKDALASIDQGGLPEAMTRVAALMRAAAGDKMPLDFLDRKHALVEQYRELLPALAPDEWRRIRGEQDIVVRYEPQRALETLPQLVSDPAERKRLLALMDRVAGDARLGEAGMGDAPRAVLAQVRKALEARLPARAALRAS
jgi:pimeloyl-ACP methyl ester carboxylesterase